MMLLEDKVVLVTGGGRGIGAAISRVCAREGAAVAINCYNSVDGARDLAESIEEDGGTARAWCCDVRDPVSVKEMVAVVHQAFGRLDCVINNAIAGTQSGPLDEVFWEDYENSFDYGAKAVINTVSAVRPLMKKQGGGSIINIVTELWNVASAGWSVYLAGKGAMVGISRSMAAELGPENITVNMVAPGWMKTEKITEGTDTSGYTSGIPLRRQGDAEEIGKVCAFLASDMGAFVSGAYIPVSGGSVRQTGN